jgi:hypothetical protein
MEIEEIRNLFNNTERLYHYTSYDNAIKILQSHTLLFGRLKDMNDINELYRPLAFFYHLRHENRNNDDIHEKMKEDFYKYQQISLTMDGNRMGFDIPAMWGHYAQNGNGVCLVFDKSKFISYLNEEKRQRHIVFDKVKYKKDYSSVVTYETDANNNLIPFRKREEKDYFFHKTKDWSYEQELRVIIKSNSERREKLDFRDSLLSIAMHNAESVGHEQTIFASIEHDIISKVAGNDITILEHSAWFNNTQLTIRGETVWESNPIDLNRVNPEE